MVRPLKFSAAVTVRNTQLLRKNEPMIPITAMNTFRTALLLLNAVAMPALAIDWPQYGGPQFNRSTAEKIQKVFPVGGPKTVWRVPTTDGFSSFTVSGGKAFTLVLRDFQGAPRETVVALDANSGKEVWSQPLG